MKSLAPAASALWIAACAGAQIHIAPSGSDAGTGSIASPFRTINHAAAVAAPGSTLFLQAGVYGNEQGIVQLGTKDLVLQGAGVASTILLPHSSSTTPLVPVAAVSPVAVPHRVGMLLSGTARIHVRSLTIDAQSVAPAGGQLAGIYLRGGVDVVCDHGLGLRNARAFSIAVIAAALDPAPTLLPNSILVANIGATWAVVTNVLGTSAVPLPVPPTAVLAGLPVYCQAGVFDPNGNDTFLPGFALTNGLKLRLGY